jgi:phosphoglycolate phosphatase-like HAD superfamily hydrolase
MFNNKNLQNVVINLKNYETIIFDYDGVIKESVQIKTNAFRNLFAEYSPVILNRIMNHHEVNGGISRYDKISYYFDNYIGEKLSKEQLDIWCEKYSRLVMRQVINSPWVPGVLAYLQQNHQTQHFYIATGTPQQEIEYIVKKTKIRQYFKNVFGSPNKKEVILSRILKDHLVTKSKCIMIGDAMTDYLAAKQNNIKFILRETDANKAQFNKYRSIRLKNFL